jgi:hypothetical protein
MTLAAEEVRQAIGEAEEVRDPLDGLVERTAGGDVGAPFAQEVIERLVELKQRDRAAFEALRAQLKRAGCRVGGLDAALAAVAGGAQGRGPSQADILIELARAADLFHTADGTGYADFEVKGHRETWSIRSKGFKKWLAHGYYEETGGAPSSDAMQSALGAIEAKAHYDAPERVIYLRVGEHDGNLYLDLADEQWRAVEIDPTGWRVIDRPPVRFLRAAGMLPLPVPQTGGSIERLRSFVNLKTTADFVLVVAWMLAALRSRGPYPLLVVAGEQGSAKSSFTRAMRSLLDPNTASLRALPREDRDLFIAATNGHVLAFDNVSGLSPWLSDTFCRLATGGGFAVRQLFTDADEVLFEAMRPVILNGIDDIVGRPDLADRAIFLTLEPIPEERRLAEADLWAAFEKERPFILGVLLDALVEGMKRLPGTRLERLPRMADFALWATACETALWRSGTFGLAYSGNRDDAVESVIEADPVATAVREMIAERTEWSGTAEDLLGRLCDAVPPALRKEQTWPKNPRALSGRLRRAATFLRKAGVMIVFNERSGKDRRRLIRIRLGSDNASSFSSAPSASSACAWESSPDAAADTAGERTVVGHADGREGYDARTVRAEGHESRVETEADGADASFPDLSAREDFSGDRWVPGAVVEPKFADDFGKIACA